jgi:hypothetical protein
MPSRHAAPLASPRPDGPPPGVEGEFHSCAADRQGDISRVPETDLLEVTDLCVACAKVHRVEDLVSVSLKEGKYFAPTGPFNVDQPDCPVGK